MHRLDRMSRWLGTRRPLGTGATAARTATGGGMPLRHKLMLVLAFEIMALGFRQAEMRRQDKGIVVEAPAHAGNAIV
ncbi:hypothetical protein [Methylobacterium marchantiae]|uniref:Uncharacterized protein n=1 Tax=Methylobacterium marchantiae TaxID=600331 RepID=A0ABW3X0E6_9HYPH|nr:hypothetical protein AIGOOFII_1170 [Methylobacterium marchantiae]